MTTKLNPRELIALLFRVEKLIGTTSYGAYDSAELNELGSLITTYRTEVGISEKRISETGKVSVAVIRNAASGGNPKFQNFIAILSGLHETIAIELINIGVLSGSYSINRTSRIRIRQFTDAGTIQKLLVELENFQKLLSQTNDPDALVSTKSKEIIIELLESMLNQLKGAVIETSTISAFGGGLRQFGKSVAENVKGHYVEKSAAAIIKLLEQLFGNSQ